jgi:hypothetical protein
VVEKIEVVDTVEVVVTVELVVTVENDEEAKKLNKLRF